METQDTSFKSREELLQWIMDKKPILLGKNIYEFGSEYSFTGYSLDFDTELKDYKKHFEPKPKIKITLYRHFIKAPTTYGYMTNWAQEEADHFENVIYTETREIEIEVDRE